MKMKRSHTPGTGFFAGIIMLLMLATATPALAVSTISISPAGDGIFALQGIGIEDASAMEINVTYDTSTLANPRVVEGSFITGAMSAINPNVAGLVRIVSIRIAPMKGSGLIATLTFTRTGPSAGRILSLSAKLANVNGTRIASQVQVVNPADSASESSTASQPQSASSGIGASGTTVIVAPPGIITGPSAPSEGAKPPQETTEHKNQSPVQNGAPEPTTNERVAAGSTELATESGEKAAPALARTPKVYSPKSVLDRFREFKGPRTADAFIALFDQENMIGYKQNPAVVIADGKSVVAVSIITPPGLLSTSDVKVTGAKLLSLAKDSDNTNTWIIKLRPQKGVYQTSLTVTLGDVSNAYPVSVAPKADIKREREGKITKAVFDRFFKKLAGNASQAPDLNGDGKWDYYDDYILTANYLNTIRKVER
jgi:hypothetical protein